MGAPPKIRRSPDETAYLNLRMNPIKHGIKREIELNEEMRYDFMSEGRRMLGLPRRQLWNFEAINKRERRWIPSRSLFHHRCGLGWSLLLLLMTLRLQSGAPVWRDAIRRAGEGPQRPVGCVMKEGGGKKDFENGNVDWRYRENRAFFVRSCCIWKQW